MPAGNARTRDDHVVRGLRLRLLLVLALLALLVAGGYLLFRAQTAALDASAGVVNLCGRQRMLSQRAALLIDQLDGASEAAERERQRAALARIADSMEDHARRLLGGGPALAPPEVRAQVLDSPHDLPGLLRRFIDGVRAAADPGLVGPASDDARVRPALTAARDGSILEALDHVVGVMQAHSEAGVARLRRLQLANAVLLLATLATLVVLVFRPMLRDLHHHLDELRQSREALREQRRQLQLNFENAPLGIARCSLEGSLLSVNPALCAVLGRAATDLVGLPIEELFHADDYPRLRQALDRPRHELDASAAVMVRLRHGDGSWVQGVLHWSFVPDETGTPIGWIAHFEDRTRQLEAEEQARQDRERLAQVGRLHTLGEMAAAIAHEVNQPLTAISSYAQAGRRLLETGLTDAGTLAETLDKVSGQAQRAGDVIRGLRTFVRQRESRSERVDLNSLVREAIALAQADAHFFSVDVEAELEEGIAEVSVDPVQIQQVVLNLIRNAFDALERTDRAEPIVVRTAGDGDGFIQVAVEDRGLGIPGEAAEHLFDPFFTSKPSGLGMGLAISRSIVTGHGGRIWWTPAEGGGTVFRFTLPAAAPP